MGFLALRQESPPHSFLMLLLRITIPYRRPRQASLPPPQLGRPGFPQTVCQLVGQSVQTLGKHKETAKQLGARAAAEVTNSPFAHQV